MAEIMNRLRSAMNAHDVAAFVACFAPDYETQQPAHPRWFFRGSAERGPVSRLEDPQRAEFGRSPVRADGVRPIGITATRGTRRLPWSTEVVPQMRLQRGRRRSHLFNRCRAQPAGQR